MSIGYLVLIKGPPNSDKHPPSDLHNYQARVAGEEAFVFINMGKRGFARMVLSSLWHVTWYALRAAGNSWLTVECAEQE